MRSRGRAPKVTLLVVMAFLGLIYLVLLANLQPVFSTLKADGIVSVLFGLFICSHPSANLLDVLLFRRYLAGTVKSTGREVLWWVLNGLVMFTGWYIIFLGMLRFNIPSG
jgi:hypothetical protein